MCHTRAHIMNSPRSCDWWKLLRCDCFSAISVCDERNFVVAKAKPVKQIEHSFAVRKSELRFTSLCWVMISRVLRMHNLLCDFFLTFSAFNWMRECCSFRYFNFKMSCVNWFEYFPLFDDGKISKRLMKNLRSWLFVWEKYF